MLQEILDYKNALKKEFNGKKIDLSLFIKVLNENKSKINSVKLNRKFTNYLHATLVACYLEKTKYDLNNWQEYFSEVDSISDILNVDTPNEWDVFEYFALHSINQVFDFSVSGLEIKAFIPNNNRKPLYLTDDSFKTNVLSKIENNLILESIKVKMKIRGLNPKSIWGDNDIIVCVKHNNQFQHFCIISCKLSLRERVYQSIFWALHSRLEGTGRHVFLTADKGIKGKTEIGSRNILDKSAKKSRNALESTMDRVYVLRNENEVNRSQVIKNFERLKIDLIIWADDILGI